MASDEMRLETEFIEIQSVPISFHKQYEIVSVLKKNEKTLIFNIGKKWGKNLRVKFCSI